MNQINYLNWLFYYNHKIIYLMNIFTKFGKLWVKSLISEVWWLLPLDCPSQVRISAGGPFHRAAKAVGQIAL